MSMSSMIRHRTLLRSSRVSSAFCFYFFLRSFFLFLFVFCLGILGEMGGV
jgi:hypothetical protein